jgi:predicted PhzF superfamily epimerase YddE/YHI9
MLIYDSEEDIASLTPDFAEMAKINTVGIIATAPGRDVDFVSRFFAPKAGINEDPVTGSAHCTLIPYWADRLGKSTLSALQLSKRRGDVQCAYLGERVMIAGQAVTYMQGEIYV